MSWVKILSCVPLVIVLCDLFLPCWTWDRLVRSARRFAAEIFHGLHEEVMVTAARGHSLLVRVQQVEADFPAIERAFLSQTGHSAFFSSSGISWHPNLQTEQNLITKGDLPRFVMDSYEECRGPPRLFLLDKFDVAGAGACLKRYTDPSFYKVETSSFEMMSAEAQRDKRIRKTKKKGSRLKNGETPEAFQSSHVKLHQLLLEERVQNVANEPARRVKLKKRDIKFPFDTETGKGYMEKLLDSPPEDKLVHEVPKVSSPLRLPTSISGEPQLETLEDRMANSPLGSPRNNGSRYESQIVDKTVSMEHINNVHANSSIDLQADGIEEKHISVNEEHKSDGVEEGYQSDDVASETDNYMDALATMESEVETDVELRANSDQSIKRENFSDTHIELLQSQFSDSLSASEDESSSLKNKITSFSYSDTSSSVDNMSPRGVNSPHAFASTEIPFRPRVAPEQASDNSTEVSDNAALPMDQGVISKESTSKESDLSELSSNNCVDVSSRKKNEESESDLEDIVASTSELDDVHSSTIDNESDISNINLVTSHVEEQPSGPTLDEPEIDDGDVNHDEKMAYSADNGSISKRELADDFLESKSVPEEAGVPYSNGDEAELQDKESVSADSVCDSADDINGDDDLSTLEGEKELKEREAESVNLESKDLAPVFVPADVDSNESKGLEVDSGESETVDVSCDLDENEDNGLFTTENGLVINESVEKDSTEQLAISPESVSVPSAYYDHSNINDLDDASLEKEASEQQVVSSELDSIPSVSYDHLQDLNSIPTSSLVTCDDLNENDVDGPSTNSKIMQDENILVTEKTDQNGVQVDMSPDESNAQFLDSAPDSPMSAEAQESKSSNFVEQNVDQLVGASSIMSHSASTEEMADQSHLQSLQLETVDSEPYPVNHEATLEPSMADLSQLSSHDNLHGFNMLPQLAPINIEESPPLPPLPPMQWRMGKLQNTSMSTMPDGGLHGFSNFPSPFPPIETPPPLDQNENITNEKSDNGYEDMESSCNKLPTEPSVNTEEVAERIVPQPPSDTKPSVKTETEEVAERIVPQPPSDTEPSVNTETEEVAERIVPQPPSDKERPVYVFPTEREIIRPSSSLPLVDDERPNGIRPMKIQRPRTPLIDAVAAHDKSKLRKVSERAMPPIQKEEDRGTLLEQIRLKSFNLKPAVQTRPSIQGPRTNLTVAAILEKANAIRQAAAGSDDDSDNDDSWSDS
nr:protein SCAR4-like [Tanacetum cinerariifolium]